MKLLVLRLHIYLYYLKMIIAVDIDQFVSVRGIDSILSYANNFILFPSIDDYTFIPKEIFTMPKLYTIYIVLSVNNLYKFDRIAIYARKNWKNIIRQLDYYRGYSYSYRFTR